MNSYERLHAMVEGKEVDRPGATIWKHFFLEDRVVEDCVKKHIAFQEAGVNIRLHKVKRPSVT